MAEKETEEFEMIPVSPLRKMEKRLEELERGRESVKIEFLVKEVLDMVKSNQSLVDEVIKSDERLRMELEKLPSKIDEMVTAWKEFISVLKEASGGDGAPSGDMGRKFDALLEQNNEMLKANREILVSLESMRRGLKSDKPDREYPRIRIRPKDEGV
ncbi:MAG: hypothetical protein HZB68_01950 [Candidatus Aenigmarchaeota archaeon]|nr:hypothetical protein [Candidatus Aenigmarchaeota archaeon]